MADTLNVTVREARGTRSTRRERDAGKTPAVLYGHGKETVCLSCPTDEVQAAIRHGSHIVTLAGGLSEKAQIWDVQWDNYGIEVLHLDLTRVTAGELIEVTVAVELRGLAPGAKEGGIVNHVTHSVELECPVEVVPDKLEANINSLALGQSITAGELELPPGAKLLSDSEDIIVQCEEPAPELDEEGAAAEGTAEPEVIGRKEDEESESED